MKPFILSLCLFAIIAHNARADSYIFKGDTVFTNDKSPLETYPAITTLRDQLKEDKSACFDCSNAPYQAEWNVINNQLYLTNIYGASTDKKLKADINKLFHVNNGRVAANWVTQQIWIPEGQPVRWSDVTQPLYKAEYRLIIVMGNVVESKEFNYPTAPNLIDNRDKAAVRKVIYNKINWDKIPDMKDTVVRVVIAFTTGRSGKPEKIHPVKPTDQSIFVEEAQRVVRQLAWPAAYRHGTIVPEYFVLPIIFNEEMRKSVIHKGNH